MNQHIKDDQITFIQKIKNFMQPHQNTTSELAMENKETNDVDDKQPTEIKYVEPATVKDNLNLEDLVKRIERVESLLSQGDTQDRDGVRKNKVKEQIISLLKQNKKLSSLQMSKLIGLSRTRCNEYFRELTKEGLTEGVIINRQKFYRLVKE